MLQSLNDDARKELTPLKLRNKAAKFAKSTVQSQMASFKVIYILLLSGLHSFIIDLLFFLYCCSAIPNANIDGPEMLAALWSMG